MIARDLNALDGGRFDIAIVGGGVHGAAIALEAAERGLSVALLERNDFGSGSTSNSLRILHGGLRYLQSADVPRFRESVAARKWYAHRFPQLVRPLPCLMPLYGSGAKRPIVLRAALAANDLLSADRNRDLVSDVHLPPGRVLGREETRRLFPSVRTEGLTGAALWYDYQMVSSERVLMEMLREAVRCGAIIANYTEAMRHVTAERRIQAVVCRDRISGRELTVRASTVINCAGPLCGALAAQAGCAGADFAPPSVAFNVLFDSSTMGACAMAVAAPEPDAPVLFVCPSQHGVWAGTAHVGRRRGDAYPTEPTVSEVEGFVGGLRRAVPQFAWSDSRIRHVFWGVLPVTAENSINLTVRPEIVAHPQAAGLYSVVGIKYTTAARVATQALRRIFGSRLPERNLQRSAGVATLSASTSTLLDGDAAAKLSRDAMTQLVEQVVREEAVFDADDMLLRRTNWLFTAADPPRLRAAIAQVLSANTPSSAQRFQSA